jgi:UDP-N-acetyl-D-glucosamine dehydrogenase
MLGVAYKQDIDDYRESPALDVIEILEKQGAVVTYYDPWVAEYQHKGKVVKGEKELNAGLLEEADLVMITTAHSNVDYHLVQKHAKAIFDTKNVMKDLADRDNIEVL